MYQACISMYLTCISMYLFFRAKGHIHNVCIKACIRHVSTCIHVSACIRMYPHVSYFTTYYGATLCTRQMPTMREGGNSKELKRGLSSPQHTSPPQQRTSSLTTT